ncbi:hypothetical protein [Nonomuraea sp. KM88]|uniref:hypothetical protein n=1 Tax=Nonomuraea sp. KM88 TaxID=3457427 RepID=UPI003FCCF2FC
MNRWIWRGPNEFARDNGWEIDQRRWGARHYRDPRFNARKKEMMEAAAKEGDPDRRSDVRAVSEPPPRRFGNHPQIPVAHDPGAAAGLV